MAVVQGSDPLGEAGAQGRELQPSETFAVRGQIFIGTRQQRARSHLVPGRVVVQADGDLDQALQEFLFFGGCGAPNVFQSFVGIEKFPVVKQLNATTIAGEIHEKSKEAATDKHRLHG